MRTCIAAITGAVAITALVATATPSASAGQPAADSSSAALGEYIDIVNSNHVNNDCVPEYWDGHILFDPRYDKWYITDRERDGYSVRARVWVDGAYKGTFYQADNGGRTTFDRAYPNGAHVSTQIFLRKDSSGYFCGFRTGGGTA